MTPGEVNRPDAGAGAYVEDVGDGRSNGCDVERLIREGLKPDVVLCIWSNE